MIYIDELNSRYNQPFKIKFLIEKYRWKIKFSKFYKFKVILLLL